MTDPGYLAYVIAESSFVRTVKDMKHIRTEVCRKLPSGTNEQGWLEIFKKCTISREISKPCMEVFYLLSMLQDRNLEDVDLSFTNLVDPSLQHEHQMFRMDKPDKTARILAQEMTDDCESGVLSLSLSARPRSLSLSLSLSARQREIVSRSRLVAEGIASVVQVLVPVDDVLVELVTLDVSPKAICEEAQRSESFVRSKRSALSLFMT
jgi:hypothetical protein